MAPVPLSGPPAAARPAARRLARRRGSGPLPVLPLPMARRGRPVLGAARSPALMIKRFWYKEVQHPHDHRSCRCAVSLKVRTNQLSAATMSREMDALSAELKANGLDPVARASALAITPPCE